MEHLNLDEVIFLPAHRNPLKSGQISPAKQRLEMVRRMVAEEPKMAVSDIEISRGGPSYMVESLLELQMVRPGEYWLLLGADALSAFDRWKNPAKILKLCRLAVALRPPAKASEIMGRLKPQVRESVDLVDMPSLDISSSTIRNRLATGEGHIAPLLPPSVIQYIRQNRMYEK